MTFILKKSTHKKKGKKSRQMCNDFFLLKKYVGQTVNFCRCCTKRAVATKCYDPVTR